MNGPMKRAFNAPRPAETGRLERGSTVGLLPSLCFALFFCGYGLVSFLPDLIGGYPRLPVLAYRLTCVVLALEMVRRGTLRIFHGQWKAGAPEALVILFWSTYMIRIVNDYLFVDAVTLWDLQDYLAYTVGVSVLAASAMLLVRDEAQIKYAPLLCAGICAVVCAWAAIFGLDRTPGEIYRLVANDRLNPILLGHSATTLLLTVAWWSVSGKQRIHHRQQRTPVEAVVGLTLVCLAVVSVALGVYALGLSASRSPVIALVIGMAILALASGRKAGFVLLSVAVVVYAAQAANLIDRLTALGISIDRVTESSELLGAYDRSGRAEIYFDAWSAFVDSPLVGKQLFLPTALYPHNTVLEALMATGLAGTLPLLAWFFLGGVNAVRHARRHPVALWLLLMFSQSLVGAFTSGAIFYDPMLWTTAGLTVGLRAWRATESVPAATLPTWRPGVISA